MPPHPLRRLCRISALTLTFSAALWGSTVARAQPVENERAATLSLDALAPLVGGPTVVTLQGQEVLLKSAVEELLKAAKLPFEGAVIEADENRVVALNWNKTPFWTAAQDLEKQTGLQWVNFQYGGSAAPLRLANKRTFSPSRGSLIGLSGTDTPLVKVVANQVVRQAQRTLQLGQAANANDAPDTSTTKISLSTYFDPRLRLSPDPFSVQIKTPENARSIIYRSVTTSSAGTRSLGMGSFDIPIETKANETKLPMLAGTILADIVTKSEVWEAPNITVNTTALRHVTGATYQLDGVTLDGDQLTVKIVTTTTGLRRVFGQPSSPFRILDGQGQEVPSAGSSSSMSTTNEGASYKGEYKYSLRVRSAEFPEGEVRPGPFKLVWDVPTELKTVSIPFEFRDVPLP